MAAAQPEGLANNWQLVNENAHNLPEPGQNVNQITLNEFIGLEFLGSIGFLPILEDLRRGWVGPLIIVMHAEESALLPFLPQLGEDVVIGALNRVEILLPPQQVVLEENFQFAEIVEENYKFAEIVEEMRDLELKGRQRDEGRYI
ncbi:unnamed protein product [Orchesella dallaii]|uniref:Uncharacterized protein n=1 Tax=Orchesella dallaii TaxID=48710 RepID=A0ABP1R1E1_9HEXA